MHCEVLQLPHSIGCGYGWCGSQMLAYTNSKSRLLLDIAKGTMLYVVNKEVA